jgi:7-carboxy-7-deazaguanine synthase
MPLRITEIFYSLQGESRTAGFPTAFIRLTGCPLRCRYCDTSYAFKGGSNMEIATILEKVAAYKVSYVTVTGGEPLAQKACLDLLTELCDQANYNVSLETSGALDIASVDKRATIVMDLKTPGSGEVTKNLYTNIDYLKKDDQLKFVIASRDDYDWSKNCLTEYKLDRFEVLFSPVHEKLEASNLADWILEDRLKVRMQIQLHKILWGDARGH